MKTLKYFFFRFICYLFLFFLFGCGKKQKNIFDFSKKEVFKKVNKFELGFIKNVKVEKKTFGNLITWDYSNVSNQYVKNFSGFFIYRLVRSSIIPKKSLNKKPILENKFLDKEILSLPSDLKQKNYCYVVRPVFFIEKRKILGLLSQIVCS
ncbi:hypothetical protein GF385_03455 [Candidatus Dependentiae bacterium]|nr:hypothetical protein [Candidatus Dependentiae bacterium]